MRFPRSAPTIALAGACVIAVLEFSAVANGQAPRAADKLVVRKSSYSIQVPEIRAARTNDVLSVQADFLNDGYTDKFVYYRFRWIDADGNQVGDGEVWKQMVLLGKAQQTVKAVAPSSKAGDFQIELNVQRK